MPQPIAKPADQHQAISTAHINSTIRLIDLQQLTSAFNTNGAHWIVLNWEALSYPLYLHLTTLFRICMKVCTCQRRMRAPVACVPAAPSGQCLHGYRPKNDIVTQTIHAQTVGKERRQSGHCRMCHAASARRGFTAAMSLALASRRLASSHSSTCRKCQQPPSSIFEQAQVLTYRRASVRAHPRAPVLLASLCHPESRCSEEETFA